MHSLRFMYQGPVEHFGASCSGSLCATRAMRRAGTRACVSAAPRLSRPRPFSRGMTARRAVQVATLAMVSDPLPEGTAPHNAVKTCLPLTVKRGSATRSSDIAKALGSVAPEVPSDTSRSFPSSPGVPGCMRWGVFPAMQQPSARSPKLARAPPRRSLGMFPCGWPRNHMIHSFYHCRWPARRRLQMPARRLFYVGL